MASLQEHWRAFWKSGPENLYSFLWWSIYAAMFGAIVMAVFALWQFVVAFLATAALAWTGAFVTRRYQLGSVPSSNPASSAFQGQLKGALVALSGVTAITITLAVYKGPETGGALVHDLFSRPTPTIAPNINTRPHQLTVDWPDFFPSWTLDLEGRLRLVKQPCILKVSTVPEQMEFRAMLVQIATRNGVCATADDQIDGVPIPPDVDASPTPIPRGGLTIRWNKDAQPQGESVAQWFDGIGFIVNRGHALPAGSQPTEIWIDIGPGWLWKP
jgi:hypothetical protein